MIIDEFGQVYYTTDEAVESLYSQNINITQAFLSDNDEINKYNENANRFELEQISSHNKPDIDPIDYHKLLSQNWNTPIEYSNLDIEDYLIKKMKEMGIYKDVYITYLDNELQAWSKLMPDPSNLWKFLKYLIDTCKAQDIVTGVGRGSSVASLVLFLLEVHHIDPIKYNLDYKEFLR